MFKMRKTLALTILAVFAICLFVPMAAMAANPADAVATTVSKAAVTQDAAADANTGSKLILALRLLLV